MKGTKHPYLDPAEKLAGKKVEAAINHLKRKIADDEEMDPDGAHIFMTRDERRKVKQRLSTLEAVVKGSNL